MFPAPGINDIRISDIVEELERELNMRQSVMGGVRENHPG